MNVNIKNNSGQNVFAVIFGLNSSNQWCIYKDGVVHVCQTGETTHQFFYSLSGTSNSLNLSDFPQLSSGVILFSYNQFPNIFNIVPDGNGKPSVQSPPFVPGSGDANTIFNMVEFTYNSNGLNVDTTNVDYYSTPISINLIGTDSGHNSYNQSAGTMNYTRQEIFEKFDKETSGTSFNKLLMKDSDGNYVRILGPQHGVQSGYISNNLYDKYVNKCWSIYTKKKLNITTSISAYTGTVDKSGDMCFTQKGDATILYKLPKPGPGLAFDILGCCNSLAAPNNEEGAIVARIGAALNRTTLHNYNNQPFCSSEFFYPTGTTYPTNLYSKVLHECYLGGNGYAFPFDDVCNVFSSDMGCYYPSEFNITLDEFSKGSQRTSCCSKWSQAIKKVTSYFKK